MAATDWQVKVIVSGCQLSSFVSASEDQDRGPDRTPYIWQRLTLFVLIRHPLIDLP